jgi:hypothetical protein
MRLVLLHPFWKGAIVEGFMKSKVFLVGMFSVMLACALVLAGCTDTDPKEQELDVGGLSVTVGNDATRTVLPVGVQLDHYEVSFQPQNGQDAVTPRIVEGSGGTLNVELQVGGWAIAVVGYEGNSALVKGSKTVNIQRGAQAITIPVTLPNAGTGTFAYSIDAGGGSGTLTLTPTGGTDGSPQERTISNTAEANLNVPSGFYRLQVSLANGTALGHFEAVHVYPGKVSPYNLIVAPGDYDRYSLSGTIQIELGAGSPPSFINLYAYADQDRTTQIGSGSIENGAWSLTVPASRDGSTIYFAVEIVDTFGSALLNVRESHTLDGDATNINLGTVTAAGRAEIAFTTAWQDDASIQLSSYAIRDLSKALGETATINLSNSEITSYQWFLDGEPIAGATGSSFTIYANSDSYTTGVHYLAVEVYLNGAPYSRELRFRIVTGDPRDASNPLVTPYSGTILQYSTENEPNNPAAWASAGWTLASLDENGEVDYYTFTAQPGKTYHVQTNAYYNGSSQYYYRAGKADVTVSGYRETANGTQLFYRNNWAYSSPSIVRVTEPTTIYLEVKAWGPGWPLTGAYAIRVLEQ